jgi:hypothetical protein
MNLFAVRPIVFIIAASLTMTCAISQPALGDDNPLAKYLKVPGATVTFPVSEAKQPFPLDFANDAREKFENFHYQLGGDHAVYYNLHLSEMLTTAVSAPNMDYKPLKKTSIPKLALKLHSRLKKVN